jgi:hypothetical protein
MTEKQYEERRAAIMRKVYQNSVTFADNRPKFPRCLKADMRELKKLEQEWTLEKQ